MSKLTSNQRRERKRERSFAVAMREELEKNQYGRKRRSDYQLAEGIGNRHFKPGDGLVWDCVRQAFNACHRTEAFDSFAVIGGRAPQRNAQAQPDEKLLHEALRRQHKRHFKTLCDYLGWLCEGLLPRVLFNPRRDYLSFNRDDLCCHHEIRTHLRLKPTDLPKLSQDVIGTNIRDLRLITDAVLTNDELRAGLLTLYFLYPEPLRSTRDKIKRRPLFQALDDICVHWDKRDADDFKKPLDALAWNFDDFKNLKGPGRARAVFKKAGIDLDHWCIEKKRELPEVVRHIDRAMTDQLRLRGKRSRSQ